MRGRGLGPLLPPPVTFPGLQGFKNDYFWGESQAKMEGCFQVKLSRLESVYCAISHQNTWEGMIWGQRTITEDRATQLMEAGG